MMHDKPYGSPALGLEIGSSSIKAAELSLVKGTPRLKQTIEIPVEQEESGHVKPLYMNRDEEVFRAAVSRSLVITALKSHQVLIRPLEIKLSKIKDIDAVLEFEAEPLLPYPIEEAVIDRLVQSKTEEGTLLSVFAAKKGDIQHHLELLSPLNVEPESVSCVPVALAAFSRLFCSDDPVNVILYAGTKAVTLALVNEGKLISSYTASFGTEDLVRAAGSRSNLENLDFTKELPSMVEAKLDAIRKEISRIILSFSKVPEYEKVTRILITGEAGEFKGLGHALCKDIEIPSTFPEPTPNFSASAEVLQKFAVPIGLALTALSPKHPQVNFRQKEFLYPYPFKRLKTPIIAYLGFCVLLSFAIYLFGQAYIESQKTTLREEYLELLASTGKTHEGFEKEFVRKNPTAPAAFSKSPIPPENLSTEAIVRRINTIEQELESTPDVYPLLPSVPAVSDFLAWLASHPAVQGEEGEESKLKLVGLNYKMVKRPEQNKKREKYQVRVDLEFTSRTPRFAREFHDVLLTPNEMVDPSGEVKWGTDREKYRASFLLKDRTVYPSNRR